MTTGGSIALLPSVIQFAKRVSGAFIDGAYESATDGAPLDIHDPSTGKVIATIPETSDAGVDRAVRSAHRAFTDGRWTGLRPADRERILLKFAEAVEHHGEELAQIESWNQGKSINIARAVEVGGSVEFMRFYAGLATKITGQTLDLSIAVPPGARYTGYTRKEPIGVVAGIAPWNFPMMIGLWKIMPALAAGCTIVLKPSEITPLTTYRLAEIALEAGVPPGVFNVVHGTGPKTGTALVSHPLVRKVSFTGSTAAGKQIARLAADSITRVSLELGGKNPAIVLADADLSKVVPGLLMGGLFNSGQVCAAVSRIYVEKPLFEPLVAAMSQAMAGLSMGPGLDPLAQINPVVSAAHQARVQGHIDAARRSGAQVLAPTKPPQEGFYIAPTLVVGPDNANAIQHNEVFGPVMSVVQVASAEEALLLANDSPYGLAASLWSESLTKTMQLIPRIEAGTVWVNSHVPLDPSMPFGGFKQSGYGRDFGIHALDAYTETKSVCIAH
jgi:phenylacetaldehyde dehydrogenase